MNVSERSYLPKILSSIRGLPKNPVEYGSSKDVSNLCETVRIRCIRRLRQTLLLNVNSVQPYGYYAEETVERCVFGLLKDMEIEALRNCMASNVYRKSITNVIKVVENDTERREPFEPFRAKILSERRRLFGGGDRNGRGPGESNPKTHVSTQNSYPTKSFFAVNDFPESRPEEFGSETDRTLRRSDRNRYLLDMRKSLLHNVDRAQLYGYGSQETVVQCLDDCLSETDEDALKNCMVAKVYEERMSETIKTVGNSTEQRKLFGPLRAKIVLNNRKLSELKESDSKTECVDFLTITQDGTERADSEPNGPALNEKLDTKPKPYKNYSKMEIRKILFRKTIEKLQTVAETCPGLAIRSPKTTRLNSTQKPYDLQKRPSYRREERRDHGFEGKVSAVSVKEKRLRTRHIAADLVTNILKPVYRAGYIDQTKLQDVTKSISENLINQNYDLDEKLVTRYVFSYLSNLM